MTLVDLDDIPTEDETPRPLLIFEHLFQAPAAVAPPTTTPPHPPSVDAPPPTAATLPPPVAEPGGTHFNEQDEPPKDEPGPRFKDQVHPGVVEPDLLAEAREEGKEEEDLQEEAQEEHFEIPIAGARLITDTRIELEDLVQQLDLDRQHLEEQLEQQAVSKKRWIRGIIVAALGLAAGVAAFIGICGTSGNCRSSKGTSPAQSVATTTTAPSAMPTPTVPAAGFPPCEICGCSFCPPDFFVGNPDGVITIPRELAGDFPPEFTEIPCSLLDFAATSGQIPEDLCNDDFRLSPEFRNICGCPVLAPPRTVSEIMSITAFINNITLSNQTLRYPSNATAEEQALQWLIDIDRFTNESNMAALRQRYALSSLWFQTTTGFGSSGWATGISECAWDGVSCDAAGRLVTRLVPIDDGIEGQIPADLGLLTALTWLSLYNNGLTGTIPSSIASLTALTRLDLSANALTGTIPSSIGSLTALTRLYLWKNSLTGTIPSSLGSLTDLTVLVLSDNSLTGTIRSSIASLTDLTELYLYNNELMGTVPFCDSVSNQSFGFLVADCEKVSCPCCTHCCPTSRDGIPVFNLC